MQCIVKCKKITKFTHSSPVVLVRKSAHNIAIHCLLAGSVVGSLNFDNPGSVQAVTVVDSNPYFEFNAADKTFTVKKRIDIDQGLNTIQLMILECTPMSGPKLEVRQEIELIAIIIIYFYFH